MKTKIRVRLIELLNDYPIDRISITIIVAQYQAYDRNLMTIRIYYRNHSIGQVFSKTMFSRHTRNQQHQQLLLLLLDSIVVLMMIKIDLNHQYDRDFPVLIVSIDRYQLRKSIHFRDIRMKILNCHRNNFHHVRNTTMMTMICHRQHRNSD